MTRKDFELIAAALKASKIAPELTDAPLTAHLQFVFTCRTVATELATTNPRFDRERFLNACGAES